MSAMSLLGRRWFPKKDSPATDQMKRLLEDAWQRASQPQGAAQSAQSGAEIRQRLLSVIQETEGKIGQLALAFAAKDGVMMIHPKLLEAIRQRGDREIIEPAIGLCFPTTAAKQEFDSTWPATVAQYGRKANTQEVLREKSNALAAFITNNLDV